MTNEEFLEKIKVFGNFDFSFEGKNYRLISERNGQIRIMEENNFDSIMLFESYKAMMAHCKIENRFLKEIIKDL